MSNVTLGQLGIFMPAAAAVASVAPMAAGALPYFGLWGARLAGSLIGASGNTSVSGYAHYGGVNAIRNITILTQPPRPVVIAEFQTTVAVGTFSFPHLPAGNYAIIDSCPDNSRQAQVYDWVVSA